VGVKARTLFEADNPDTFTAMYKFRIQRGTG